MRDLFSGDKDRVEDIVLGVNVLKTNREIFDYIDENIDKYSEDKVHVLLDAIVSENPRLVLDVKDISLTNVYKSMVKYAVLFPLYEYEKQMHNRMKNIFMQQAEKGFQFRLLGKRKLVATLNNIFFCLFQLVSVEDITSESRVKSQASFDDVYISFFNKVPQILVETIIMHLYFSDMTADALKTSPKQRVSIIAYMLKCLHLAIETKNLSTAQVFFAALSHSAITRMNLVWDDVKKYYGKEHQRFVQDAELFSTKGSFKNIREFYKRNEDAVPYVGLFKQDYEFAVRGNPMYIQDSAGNKKINIARIHNVANIRRAFRRHQVFSRNAYKTSPALSSEDYAFYMSVLEYMNKCHDEEYLFKQSMIVSPRPIMSDDSF
jgi:hypothetical protein